MTTLSKNKKRDRYGFSVVNVDGCHCFDRFSDQAVRAKPWHPCRAPSRDFRSRDREGAILCRTLITCHFESATQRSENPLRATAHLRPHARGLHRDKKWDRYGISLMVGDQWSVVGRRFGKEQKIEKSDSLPNEQCTSLSRHRTRQQHHRGLTLLELLIVIGLLLAVFALTLPALTDRLSERAFDATAEQVRSHLLLMQAEAIATGLSLEVRYVCDDRGQRIETKPFSPALRTVEASEIDRDLTTAGGLGADSENSQRPTGLDVTDSDQKLRRFDTLYLSSDVHVLARLDESLIDRDVVASSIGATESEHEQFYELQLDQLAVDEVFTGVIATEESDDFRLVVYLPDGSTLLSERRWLIDRAGRQLELNVNAWTGLPTLAATMMSLQEAEADGDAVNGDVDDYVFETGGGL